MSEPVECSPFRTTLETAAARLEELGKRSSPTVALAIRREVVAIREASAVCEGAACFICEGSGTLVRGSRHSVTTVTCNCCGGTGDL